MKFLRWVFVLFILTGLLVVACACFYDTPSTVASRYTYIEDLNVYTDANIDKETLQTFTAIIPILPDNVQKILPNWEIIISEEPPNASPNIASGTTTYNQHTIWVSHTAEPTTLVHEIGHALDYHNGYSSKQDTFLQLYEQFWQSSRNFLDKNEVYKHSVSSSSEFFASVFVTYVFSYEDLREQAPLLAQYFDNLIQNMNVWLEIGELSDLWVKNQNSKPYTKLDQHTIDVSNNPLIDLNNYSFNINTFWMTEDMADIVNVVIDAAQNPDVYFPGNRTRYVVRLDTAWTKTDYDMLVSWLCTYFGNNNLDLVDVHATGEYTEISIKYDVVDAENARMQSLSKVELVLETLHEGTEKEKLLQIAHYIDEYYTYADFGNSTFDAFWNEKYSSHLASAMIFKQFADRLGIKNDIVYTMSSYGTLRCVYNRIWIEDQCYYYNITMGMAHSSNIDAIAYHANDWLS